MPSVSGSVFYSKDSYAGTIYDKFMNVDSITITGGSSSFVPVTVTKPDVVSDVPIVLAHVGSTGKVDRGLCIKTGSDGCFIFTNVERGSYILIEAYGMAPKAAATGNFGTMAEAMTKIVPKDPDISFIADHHLVLNGASHIVSLSPNSRVISISSNNIEKLYFLDAPASYVPLLLNDYILIGENLIQNGDHGTWGTLPAGSRRNTSPVEPPPYVDNSTDPSSSLSEFTYVQYAKNGSTIEPNGGRYTITNINGNINFNGVWFDTPDHSAGDETGRMMIVNGTLSSSGQQMYFFKETISGLKKHTKYLFSSWFCNLYRLHGSAEPNCAVTVKDDQGKMLFDRQSIGSLGVKAIPTWCQLGKVIDIGEATGVEIRFVSMGPETLGNDYAVDDIVFQRLSVEPQPTVQKTVTEKEVLAASLIHYRIVVHNPGPVALLNSTLTDELPEAAEVTEDEVKVTRNGVTTLYTSSDLIDGIPLIEIAVNEMITIEYSIKITDTAFLLLDHMIRNKASFNYSFLLKEEQGALSRTIVSNEVETKMILPKVNFKKGSCMETAAPKDYVRYELLAGNTGNISLQWVKVWDELGSFIDYVPTSTQVMVDKRKLNVYELQTEPSDIETLQEGAYIIYKSNGMKHTYKVIVKSEIQTQQLIRIKYVVQVNEQAAMAQEIHNIASVGYGYEYGEEVLLAPEEETNEEKKDEVTLPIIYAAVSIEKGAYRKVNDEEVAIAHMGKINCYERIIYKLTLTNTGNQMAKNVEITDNLPEEIMPDYCRSLTCGGITKKIISPFMEEEIPVTCEDIVRLDKNILSCISIRNIDVPARGPQNEPGIVEIRIYGQVLCK